MMINECVKATSGYMKFLFIALAILCTQSCSNKKYEEELNADSQGLVNVSIQDIISKPSNVTADMTAKSSSKATKREGEDLLDNATFQVETQKFSEDFLIVAELRKQTQPDHALANSSLLNKKFAKRAAGIEQNSSNQFMYKLLVFDDNEEYLTERDYVRGKEKNTLPLNLLGNRNYTFVVYSTLSLESTPSLFFVTGQKKSLSNARLSVDGEQEFTYFKKEMYVKRNEANNLQIKLEHQFSQITTVIDASNTGYTVSEVVSSFKPHNSKALISLKDGSIERNGSDLSSPVKFTTLNQTIVTSIPTTINAAPNQETQFNINNITIGSITQRNLTPFKNLKIVPGERYRLDFRIVPNDGFLIHEGQPAARINGQIWMRHNLGVDISVDPDAIPLTKDRHGNYYQFGNLNPSAPGTSNLADNFNASNNPGDFIWNSGSESKPVKTASDPCPKGFRVPTRTEFNTLINNTETSNIGTFLASNSNFEAGKVFRSKRKRDVMLILPAQGRLNVSGGNSPYISVGVANRGLEGYYHSSYSNGDIISNLFFLNKYVLNDTRAANRSNKALSMNIRCINE